MSRSEALSRRVPEHAWAWLQRSRDVLTEIETRLYGQDPPARLIDELRRLVQVDDFVRDVVLDAVCDKVFGGRPPERRPCGSTWDRGLVWWAAALQGMSAAEFEAASAPPAPDQPPLFGSPPDAAAAGSRHPPPRAPWRSRGAERRALASALRSLLASSDGEQIPAERVRRLLHDLERDGE